MVIKRTLWFVTDGRWIKYSGSKANMIKRYKEEKEINPKAELIKRIGRFTN